jgi:hypothetical protein
LKQRLTLLAILGIAVPASAAAAMHIELGRGHFVIDADEGIDTFRVVVADVPGSCQPGLTAVQRGADRIELQSTTPGCRVDPYAVLHVNPRWQRTLAIHLAAGQLDFSASALRSIASMQAKVDVGDIVGATGVERSWLVGAKLQFDRKHPGIAVNARVGAGQITFEQPADGAEAPR